MNKSFCDSEKNVYVKVLDSIDKAEREEYGSKTFKKFNYVPELVKLDTKTVVINSSTGIMSTEVDDDVLSNLVIKMITSRKKNPIKIINQKFSIIKEIDNLLIMFETAPEITSFLLSLKVKLKNNKLYPVHGDVQKQNMFINNKKIQLIDFEHFMYAPIELELVNCVFFRDSNCTNVEKILPELILFGVVGKTNLFLMLVFYAIRQVSLGMSTRKSQKKLVRGLERLENITKYKSNILIPNFKINKSVYWTVSSCFA